MKDLKKKYGSWAIVAGGTEGIGLAFSWELARLGMNIVLVARRKELLAPLARDIEKECSVHVRPIAADLSEVLEFNKGLSKLRNLAKFAVD